MTSIESAIRAAVQAMLDSIETEGWHLTQLVIAMGLERVTSDGNLESTPWLWAPPEQPDWQTQGLLCEALDLRAGSEIED